MIYRSGLGSQKQQQLGQWMNLGKVRVSTQVIGACLLVPFQMSVLTGPAAEGAVGGAFNMSLSGYWVQVIY